MQEAFTVRKNHQFSGKKGFVPEHVNRVVYDHCL